MTVCISSDELQSWSTYIKDRIEYINPRFDLMRERESGGLDSWLTEWDM